MIETTTAHKFTLPISIRLALLGATIAVLEFAQQQPKHYINPKFAGRPWLIDDLNKKESPPNWILYYHRCRYGLTTPPVTYSYVSPKKFPKDCEYVIYNDKPLERRHPLLPASAINEQRLRELGLVIDGVLVSETKDPNVHFQESQSEHFFNTDHFDNGNKPGWTKRTIGHTVSSSEEKAVRTFLRDGGAHVETGPSEDSSDLQDLIDVAQNELKSGKFCTSKDQNDHPETIRQHEYEGQIYRFTLKNPQLKKRLKQIQYITERVNEEGRQMSDDLYSMRKEAKQVRTRIEDGEDIKELLMSEGEKYDKQLETLVRTGGIFILVRHKIPEIYFIERPRVGKVVQHEDGHEELVIDGDWLELYEAARQLVINNKCHEIAHKAGRRAAQKVSRANKKNAYDEAYFRNYDAFKRADIYDLPSLSSLYQTQYEALTAGLEEAA